MAKYRKLGKTASQRKALLRAQVTSLLLNGKIETTKENKTEHGFGLMNIESAAAVYGGEVSVSCDPESYGGSFTIEVMLPVTHQTEAHHRPR